MTKQPRLALVCLGLLAAGAVSVVLFTPREPRHQGRSVTEWLDNYQTGGSKERKAGDEAFRAMGSNSVPTLVALLRARDSKFKAALSRLAARQSAMNYSYRPPGERQESIVAALEALRKEGWSAVTALIDLLDRPDRAYAALNGLMAVGVEEKSVYKRALLNPEIAVQRTAAVALSRLADGKSMRVAGWFTIWRSAPGGMTGTPQPKTMLSVPARGEASPTVVVPVLAESLSDREPGVRRAALVALGDFGAMYPSKAVPAVRAALSDPDDGVRRVATNTLRLLPKGL